MEKTGDPVAQGFREMKRMGRRRQPCTAERLARDIEAIAGFTEADPKIGHSRPTFSPSWRKARDYVIAGGRGAGCLTRVDAAGQLACPARRAWGGTTRHGCAAPTWTRSPPAGSTTAWWASWWRWKCFARRPDAPVELIVFAEEEGTTFSLGMLGSRAWAGTLGAAELRALRNAAGQDYLSAGAAHGVAPERLGAERLSAAATSGSSKCTSSRGRALEGGSSRWPWSPPSPAAGSISASLRGRGESRGRDSHERTAATPLPGAAETMAALEAWPGSWTGRRTTR